MNWGEVELLEETPLAELELLARDRDLVDAEVVAAVARARDAGVGWGLIAAALRGGAATVVAEAPAPDLLVPAVRRSA